jgi:hypothetical protein
MSSLVDSVRVEAQTCAISPCGTWADKGSKRKLWNEQSVARAIDYVLNGQGDELPDFDE